jgi:DNA-binding NarL/FixJ family response regulator
MSVSAAMAVATPTGNGSGVRLGPSTGSSAGVTLYALVVGQPLVTEAVAALLWGLPGVVCALPCADIADATQLAASRRAAQTETRDGNPGDERCVLVLTAPSASEVISQMIAAAEARFPVGSEGTAAVWIGGGADASRADLTEVRRVGIAAVVTWADHPAILRQALQEAAAGRRFESPRLGLAPTQFATAATHAPDRVPDRTKPLSPRQAEIAQLAALGHTNEEIAARLGIGLPTVKAHVRIIIQALGVSKRGQIAARLLARQA